MIETWWNIGQYARPWLAGLRRWWRSDAAIAQAWWALAMLGLTIILLSL